MTENQGEKNQIVKDFFSPTNWREFVDLFPGGDRASGNVLEACKVTCSLDSEMSRRHFYHIPLVTAGL
jgi:hypothetical protein